MRRPSCPIFRAHGSAFVGRSADNPGFDRWEQALFHIDEAMSWECVRNLRQMNKTLVLVRNLIQRGNAPEGVLECLESVNELMAETLDALDHHEI